MLEIVKCCKNCTHENEDAGSVECLKCFEGAANLDIDHCNWTPKEDMK